MLKKSKQGSNFQWNEVSGKYKIRERVQSTETSKVSIAWQRIKVVLLLIIEWITTKTKLTIAF
jgi:hypothetical protein